MDYEFMIRLVRNFPGARVDRPTYYLRRHAGPRGPASTRFNLTEVTWHWHVNEQRFFADLYHELELSEYVGSVANDSPDPPEVMQTPARISRAVVMARKGLWQLALSDLEVAVGCEQARATVTAKQRLQLQRLAERDYPLFELLDDRSLVLRLRRVLKSICSPADRLEITREMFFALNRSKHRPTIIRRIERSLHLLRILGVSGFGQYTKQKLSKLFS
jgi:hypothetical protein